MADPYLKIGSAKEHLGALEEKLRSFCTPTNAYTLTREDDIEHERHIMRMQLTKIHPEIALTVGDAIYNMRASLDQTVWNLSRIKGIRKKTQWPVIEVWNRDTVKSFERCVEGVPDEAFCEIKALQPYHRGDAFKGHPLWRLDEMCNLDKHRRIPAHGTAVEGVISGLTQEDYATGKVIMETTDECHIISMPISMKDKAQFNPTAPVAVTFGGDQSGIVETFHTIVEIYNFVAVDVLPRFDRFFS